jgi:hypothetical protein
VGLGFLAAEQPGWGAVRSLLEWVGLGSEVDGSKPRQNFFLSPPGRRRPHSGWFPHKCTVRLLSKYPFKPLQIENTGMQPFRQYGIDTGVYLGSDQRELTVFFTLIISLPILSKSHQPPRSIQINGSSSTTRHPATHCHRGPRPVHRPHRRHGLLPEEKPHARRGSGM